MKTWQNKKKLFNNEHTGVWLFWTVSKNLKWYFRQGHAFLDLIIRCFREGASWLALSTPHPGKSQNFNPQYQPEHED